MAAGIPWLSIVMAILTFFMAGGSEKENRGRALLAAGLAGAATYYVSHETEWGKRNLGEFDGVDLEVPGDEDVSPVIGDDGKPVKDSGGNPIRVPIRPNGKEPSTGFWGTLKSWGAAGTATVIGAGGAVATGNTKGLLIAGAVVVALLLLK